MGRFSKLETRSVSPAKEEAAVTAMPTGKLKIADAPSGAATLLARGDEEFFRGESKQAMRWYSRAMQDDASCLEAWVAQIRVLLLERQLREARVWITRGLSSFPDAPALLALRAVHSALSGMVRAAMGASDMILSKQGNDANAWVARGHVLLIDANKNAPFCFDQAIQQSDERDWKTPFLIGMIHDSERKWSRSIPFYEKAVERNSNLPYAWYRIGKAHAHLGHAEAARRAYSEAENLCGDDDKLRRRIQTAGSGSIMDWFRNLFGGG